MKKSQRPKRTFVVPTLKKEASLVEVTLTSGIIII